MRLDLTKFAPIDRSHSAVESKPTAQNKPDADQKQQRGSLLTSKKHPDVTAGSGQDGRERKQRDTYDWISLGIAVLGLFGLWYYAYWARIQAGASISAADAASQSAKAADTAAKASQAANQLTQQALIVGESPYVYNKTFMLKPLVVGHKATVTVEVENMGKLGADFFGEGAIVEFRNTAPEAISLGAGVKLGELVPSVPKHFEFTSADPVGIDQLRAVRKGTLTLLIYGLIRYQNPLEPKTLSITCFCSAYDPKQGLEMRGCEHPPKLSLNGRIIEPSNPQIGP